MARMEELRMMRRERRRCVSLAGVFGVDVAESLAKALREFLRRG